MPEQVVFELNSKDASTVRAWQALKNNIGAVEAQLGRLDGAQAKNARSAKQWDAQIEGIIGSVAGIATGWLSVQSVISAVGDETNRYRQAVVDAVRDSEEAFARLDKRKRRLQVTTGQGPLASEQMQRELFGVAQETATPARDVTEIALGLSSAGANEKDIVGGAKSVSEFINAQALGDGANYEQLTDALTSMILGQGKDLTQQTIDSLTSQLQSPAVKATKFKVPDLQYWAKEAQGLKKYGGLQQEDIVALAAVTRNSVDPSTGANQVRELMKNLSIAGGKKDATKALSSMGLKPGDIDMVGEDWMTAFENLRKGLDKLPEDQRQVALTKIAEGANVGQFYGITDSMQQIKSVKAGLGQSDLAKDAATFSQGPNAGAIRLQNEKEQQDAKFGAYADLYRKALENTLNEDKASKGYITRRLDQYDVAIKQGFDPETAAQYEHGSGVFNLLDPIANEMIEGPGYREKMAERTRRKFEESVGGTKAAEEVRSGYQGWRPAGGMEAVDEQGNALRGKLEAARVAGDQELYTLIRKQIDELAGLRADMKRGNAGPNVQVVMPGGAAPAKPVAAAGIGGNRP